MAYLKPKFDIASIKRDILAQAQRIEDTILVTLKIVGENTVKHARNLKTYKDQSGNLRSSIGYIILKNGKILAGSDFEVVKKGEPGSKKGKLSIIDLAANYPIGFVLIVIAGMDYALYVEATSNDVLTGPSIAAKTELQKKLNEAVKKIALL